MSDKSVWFGSFRAVGDMTEEDPANLLVRVDIPDIKTQVINVLLVVLIYIVLCKNSCDKVGFL